MFYTPVMLPWLISRWVSFGMDENWETDCKVTVKPLHAKICLIRFCSMTFRDWDCNLLLLTTLSLRGPYPFNEKYSTNFNIVLHLNYIYLNIMYLGQYHIYKIFLTIWKENNTSCPIFFIFSWSTMSWYSFIF